MPAKIWIPVAGLIIVSAAIFLIRNGDDGYRQYYQGKILDALPGLEKKAEQGEAFAAYLLGVAFWDYLGDQAKAQVWFLKSARLGDLNGAVLYALSVHNRFKDTRNTEPSKGHCIWYVKFLDMAARQGSHLAAVILGRYYAHAECVAPSELESRYYFKLASAIDPSLEARLEDQMPLSARDQEILESRLAAPNTATTDAEVLAYFFSNLDKFQ